MIKSFQNQEQTENCEYKEKILKNHGAPIKCTNDIGEAGMEEEKIHVWNKIIITLKKTVDWRRENRNMLETANISPMSTLRHNIFKFQKIKYKKYVLKGTRGKRNHTKRKQIQNYTWLSLESYENRNKQSKV